MVYCSDGIVNLHKAERSNKLYITLWLVKFWHLEKGLFPVRWPTPSLSAGLLGSYITFITMSHVTRPQIRAWSYNQTTNGRARRGFLKLRIYHEAQMTKPTNNHKTNEFLLHFVLELSYDLWEMSGLGIFDQLEKKIFWGLTFQLYRIDCSPLITCHSLG